MALISEGPTLLDASTLQPVRLVGVSVQDPLWQRLAPGPRLLPHGTSNLELAKTWGANAIRVPFHPATIRFAGAGDWLRGLAEVSKELEWMTLAARALNLKLIIDLHAIGFPADETTFEFEEPPFENLYEISQFEIESFWRHVAREFGDHPQVAAFELYNEAARNAAFGNQTDWNLHATWVEDLLSAAVRPMAPHMLAIVSGLHFGYDLEGVLKRPVKDPSVAYASHPYPHHSQAKSWEDAFGKVARKHPVLLTEVGFGPQGYFGRHHHRGFRDWELELRSYADLLQLSFFAWNFSIKWEPALLTLPPNEKTPVPNEAGRFFRDWMQSIQPDAVHPSDFSAVDYG
jgi:hypothetical protein